MAKGYILHMYDPTTCGGRVLEGAPNRRTNGISVARMGDTVTCGKDGKAYRIIGGISWITTNGRPVAGSLDSISSCPCNARIIPQITVQTYESRSRSESLASPHLAFAESAGSASLTTSKQTEPEQHAQSAKKKTGIDAGFAVIPYGSTTEAWQRLLFTENPPAGAKELFATLNGADAKYKAGSIMLLVDPEKQDSEQIEHMKAAKQRIDIALEPLTHKEANFLHNHYATIANFSSIADKGIGLAAEPVGKYFENIEKILKEIQETYKNTYMTRGVLIGEQFYVRRSQLFKELESILKVGFLNKGMKLGEYSSLKSALGLSTKSITHKWNETGISDIEGYATHLERAAKYIEAMRYVGYVGIGFSALHSINEINEACSVGREDECTKKKYTEIGSFTGGVGGGILTGSLAVPLCIAIGIGTAGTGGLICTIIAGGSLGYAGGEVGSWGGEKVGNSFYNVIEEAK